MSLRIRRGLSNEIPGPQEGELLYTTDTGKLYVGYNDDGSIVPRIVGSTIQDDDTPSLGGTLDLNGNNIVGTGNIDIDGYITATGNINLGDGAEDNVIVGGVISSSLIPSEDRQYDLGTDANRWRNGYFEGLTVSSTLNVENLSLLSNIYSADSNIFYNGDLDRLTVSSLESNSIEGNLTGSVIGNDSTMLVDSDTNTLSTGILTISENEISLISDSELNLVDVKSLLMEWTEVDDNFLNAPRFTSKASRSSGETLESVQTGDFVSALISTAYDGEEFQLGSGFLTSIDQKTGTSDVPSKVEILLNDYDGQSFEALSINSRGVTASNVFQTGTYADESERDAAIPSPEAGMIIFLQSQDDSAGFPKFQGYNGNKWVDFT